MHILYLKVTKNDEGTPTIIHVLNNIKLKYKTKIFMSSKK